MTKLSIIVPIYMIKEDYLRQCLNSLINQTMKEIEIILVDDGSTDRSGEICDEYAQNDSRIHVIHQMNQGVSVARNNGMKTASGEYIMFVDPDDWLELDICRSSYEEAVKNNADVVVFGFAMHSATKISVGKNNLSGALDRQKIKEIQLDVLRLINHRYFFDFAPPWGKLLRTDLLDKHSISYPPGVIRGQDRIFSLYMFEHICMIMCHGVVGYHYRLNANSVVNRKSSIDEHARILSELLLFVRNKHPDDIRYLNAAYEGAFSLIYSFMWQFMVNDYPYTKLNHIIDEIIAHDEFKEALKVIEVSHIKSIKAKVSAWLLKRNMRRSYLLLLKMFVWYKKLQRGIPQP